MSSPLKVRLLLLIFSTGLACGHAEVRVGDVFPSLNDAGLAGEVPVTAGKVVIVDFWASWCAPCKASFPAFAALHQEYGPRGLVIVAVSVDEKPAAYAGFIARLKPPFATLQDRDQKLVSTVRVPVMPTSYVLDRHGRVRFLHQGFHGKDTELALRRQIEALLAEQE
jgi:thiol-disulfide isomerase/thioredoxin